jgi:hypothetical protein
VALDGGQHLQQAGHDAMRTAYLERRGYRVLRFWNDDALARTDEVLDAVLAALHTPHPASLREAVPLPAPRGEGNRAAACRSSSPRSGELKSARMPICTAKPPRRGRRQGCRRCNVPAGRMRGRPTQRPHLAPPPCIR